MAAKDLILDFSEYDLDHPIADIEEIRRINPQHHEMEQLTAIVYDNPEQGICVGYKDVTEDEFWCRGHMPGMPLMPGVVMCEAAAQMCSYHSQRHNLLGAAMIGFGGMDDVRFRGTVVPGDRLVVAAQKLQLRVGAMIRCRFQCYVREQIVCEGQIRGIPIPVAALTARLEGGGEDFMLFPLNDLNPHRRFPLVTLLIIALNFGTTIWMSTLGERRQTEVALEYGFVPARLTNIGKAPVVQAEVEGIDARRNRPVKMVMPLSTAPQDVYTTFLTTMFLHGGWGHLLMNMWTLWIFGNNIEDRLGHVVYLLFYLLGGVLATLAFWASDPDGMMPVIGASGAVGAVLGAYAITFPTAKVRTLIFFVFFVIVDLPALLVLGVWFVMQVFSGMLGLWGIVMEPVAFWAHIGGFVSGMILMPLLSLGASPPGTDWRKETDDLFRFDDPRRIER